MNNEELKPCPFCGCDNPDIEKIGVNFRIRCCDCGAQTPTYHINAVGFGDVKDSWNERVTDRLEQEVAELRDMLRRNKKAFLNQIELDLIRDSAKQETQELADSIHKLLNK